MGPVCGARAARPGVAAVRGDRPAPQTMCLTGACRLLRRGPCDFRASMSRPEVGSDRDKLLRLVVSAGAPFCGLQIQALPPLDSDFIAHVAGLVEAQRPNLVPVDRAALQDAFAAFGHRPQFFTAAIGAVLSPLSGHSVRFKPAQQQAAQGQQAQDEAQMASDHLGLKPTEQVLLWRMLDQGPRFRPHDAEALRFYRDKLGRPVSVQQAQKALVLLR